MDCDMDMDNLDNQSVKIVNIKQETVNYDQSDDKAHIELELAHPNYVVDCDRIKDEHSAGHEDEGDMSTVEVKSEKLKEETFEADTKFENMDYLELNETLGIKSENDPDTISDLATYSIKYEHIEEQWDEADLFTDTVKHTKMKDEPAVEVKCEKLEEKPCMDSAKCENIDTLELNEELDIKSESDSNTMSDSTPVGAAKKKNWGKKQEVVHVEDGRKLFTCYNCNYTSSQKKGLVVHIKSGNCNLRTILNKSQFVHTRQHPLNKFICKECNKVFGRKIYLDDHVIKNHIEYITSVSYKIHTCRTCHYKTTFKSNLDKHMLTHTRTGAVKLSSCNYCYMSFSSNRSLNDHILKQHPSSTASVSSKIHECIHCSYKSTYANNLAAHMMNHTGKSERLLCVNCDASFKSKRALEAHILKKHPSFTASVSCKIHECVHCSYKTTYANNLAVHMIKHAEKTERLLSANCDIDKHMLTRGVKLSSCNYCYMSFSSKRSLNDHILKKHPSFTASVSSKIHECIHCSYKTTYANNFAVHMMNHAGKSERLLCVHCDASFKSKRSLDDHILKKHPSFTASVSCKRHECMHCSYKTTFVKNLARHMMKHVEKSSGVSDPLENEIFGSSSMTKRRL